MTDKFEVLKWFTTFQGCMALILNGGLVLYLTMKKLHQRRITNLMLVNMFLSHFVENVVTILYGTVLRINKDTNTMTRRNIINLSTTMALLSSFCNLPLTGERLIAIKWPFIYQIIESNHAYIACVLSWLPPISYYTFARVYQLDEYYGDLMNATLILTTLVLLAIANGLIYSVARKQKRKIAGLKIQATTTTSTTSKWIDKSDIETKISKGKTNKRSIKASFICIGLVMNYIVFWSPTCFLDLIKIGKFTPDVVSSGDFSTFFFVRFALLNSFFDPIIYVLMIRDIRIEIKKTLKNIFDCCDKDNKI